MGSKDGRLYEGELWVLYLKNITEDPSLSGGVQNSTEGLTSKNDFQIPTWYICRFSCCTKTGSLTPSRREGKKSLD